MDLDLPAVDAVDPEDRPRHLGPPGADQSRDADDLAPSDLERDVAAGRPGGCKSGHLQRDRARIVRSLGNCCVSSRPTISRISSRGVVPAIGSVAT